MKKRTVFILGASSDIGVSILKRYLDNDYEIVAHYNKGSKNFFDLVDQNPDIKKIKFNFSTNLKNINNFLKNSVIKNLVITDTIDNSQKTKSAKNIEVLPISGLMAEAIKRISNSTSVSDLFK